MATLEEKRQRSMELYNKSRKTPSNIVYNPSDENHRYALAYRIRDKLLGKLGFIKTSFHKEFHSGECVYLKHIHKDIYIAVYTTIRFHECREKSKDAIRVVCIYRDNEGTVRPLAKTERVFRRGTIKDIVSRVSKRVEVIEERLGDSKHNGNLRMCPRTGCTAPMFLSKKGRWVCAKFCYRTVL